MVSESVLGNGIVDNIKDVVYIMLEAFDVKFTPDIALELENINRALVDMKRPYLLIGFGRWGTSDPQGGIPVNSGKVSGVKAIIASASSDLSSPLEVKADGRSGRGVIFYE